MTELADALLEAQIAFAKRQLRDGDMFGDLVAEEIDHFLADAGKLTLGEVVTPARIQDTAYKYAVQLPVEGAILELVGEIAGRLYRHRVNDEVAVAEVLDVREFDDLLVTIADLDVVQRVLQRILTDPVTEDIFVEVVVRAVDDAVTQGADGGGRTGVVGFLRGGLSRAVTPAMPVVERGVEQATRAGMHFVLGAAQGDVALVDAAREVWRRNATESVGTFRELVTADDVEDGWWPSSNSGSPSATPHISARCWTKGLRTCSTNTARRAWPTCSPNWASGATISSRRVCGSDHRFSTPSMSEDFSTTCCDDGWRRSTPRKNSAPRWNR